MEANKDRYVIMKALERRYGYETTQYRFTYV